MTDLNALLLRLDDRNSFALFANTGFVRTERRTAVENVSRSVEVCLIAQATCQAAQEVRRQSQELRAASRILRRAA
jgi:hypothetical protein